MPAPLIAQHADSMHGLSAACSWLGTAALHAHQPLPPAAQVTKRVVFATAIVCTGCVLLVSFGNHESPTLSTHDMLELYSECVWVWMPAGGAVAVRPAALQMGLCSVPQLLLLVLVDSLHVFYPHHCCRPLYITYLCVIFTASPAFYAVYRAGELLALLPQACISLLLLWPPGQAPALQTFNPQCLLSHFSVLLSIITTQASVPSWPTFRGGRRSAGPAGCPSATPCSRAR